MISQVNQKIVFRVYWLTNEPIPHFHR